MAGYELSVDKKVNPAAVNTFPTINVTSDIILKISDETDINSSNYLRLEKFISTTSPHDSNDGSHTDVTSIKVKKPNNQRIKYCFGWNRYENLWPNTI